ncbi:MAG: hypothetical protein DRR08_28730 [Candidatus Parabeggiatoa sp. nov. 2]|nr:MAG: hypothetical protein B6247_27740 [Beggiatoa sp. 4572_84]RKZ52004.1 MAG: hypothetical protein DRR08_28730 [Gammaproteobacteria bacterium]HEC85583.1 hypothetical protein [Thioploca sp.]
MKRAEIPTAIEMGTKLDYLSRLLFREQLIHYRSKSHIDKLSKQLKELGATKTWQYLIQVSKPIEFVPMTDKKLSHIAPRVYLTVAVKSPDKEGISPFTRLVTVIEVWDILNGELQSRWHIDLANCQKKGAYQAGPLFHLQGGGLLMPQAEKTKELKVSIPRWAYPPMELILTSEMIVANFYPDKWKKIRGQKKWLELVYVAQRLCYPTYFQRIQKCLSEQPQSVLNALWATDWG